MELLAFGIITGLTVCIVLLYKLVGRERQDEQLREKIGELESVVAYLRRLWLPPGPTGKDDPS
jgi:hypothetical protein